MGELNIPLLCSVALPAVVTEDVRYSVGTCRFMHLPLIFPSLVQTVNCVYALVWSLGRLYRCPERAVVSKRSSAWGRHGRQTSRGTGRACQPALVGERRLEWFYGSHTSERRICFCSIALGTITSIRILGDDVDAV